MPPLSPRVGYKKDARISRHASNGKDDCRSCGSANEDHEKKRLPRQILKIDLVSVDVRISIMSGLEWLMVPATRSGIVVDVEARVIPGTTVQRLECQNNNSRQGISSGWRILLQTLKLETFNDPPNDHFARLQGLVAFPKIRFRSGYHHYEFMKKIFPKPAFREPEGIPRGSNKIEALKTGKLPSRRTEIRSFRRIKRSLSILKEKCMANAPVSNLRTRILEAQREAAKDLKSPTEGLRGLDAQFESKENGAIHFVGRIWVPSTGGLRKVIMDEAHASRYSVQSVAE
ncbi:hypothetical protein Tco_1236229 [Tanacetum coccineum]